MKQTLHYTADLGVSLEITHDNLEILDLDFISKKQIQKTYLENNIITKWLDQYFSQQQPKQKLKWKLQGTEFQLSVWETIASIPFGKTMTYQEIAAHIKKPKASRAVGTACGANPIPLFIPCHRVLGKTGLGGFTGGLAIKKKLLSHERVSY